MHACALWSMPWSYISVGVIVVVLNIVYVQRKARPEHGFEKHMRVGIDMLTRRYDDEWWARFVRGFAFFSILGFPVFSVLWWYFAQTTFPVCQ